MFYQLLKTWSSSQRACLFPAIIMSIIVLHSVFVIVVWKLISFPQVLRLNKTTFIESRSFGLTSVTGVVGLCNGMGFKMTYREVSLGLKILWVCPCCGEVISNRFDPVLIIMIDLGYDIFSFFFQKFSSHLSESHRKTSLA